MTIAVSACLLGHNCKYDGTNNQNLDLLSHLEKHTIIPICPEVLGGLGIPRKPAEVLIDKVINIDGEDFTKFFKDGAYKALDKINKNNIKKVILKSKSPSCGYLGIYDGTFSHNLICENGICSQILLDAGIKIYTENTFWELFKDDKE